MRLFSNLFTAAIAALCLTIAACGGAGSGNSPASASANANAIVRSSVKSATESTDSVSGTTIPAATQIIDLNGCVWTLSGGVVYVNGAPAGYSKAVTLLLYDNEFIYQENAVGNWWSWNGRTWVSASDPRKVSSPGGTSIPAASQITDSAGNVWAVSNGVVYENGDVAGFTRAVTLLLLDNDMIYQENASGGWWSWNSGSWTSSSDPRKQATSPNGTTIPTVAQIIDSSGNVWTVSGGIVYENGAAAGYSKGVTTLVYDNNALYQENAAGGWWTWNGSSWTSSSDPVAAPPGGGGTITISGSPPTSDLAGQAFSFVPTTSNPGGGAVSFSITNKPAWASFNTVTGALTGTPGSADAGAYSNIVISASNGSTSASLAAFSIMVTTGSATLSWSRPTENTNGTPITDLAGYTIYYGNSMGAMTQTIRVPNPSAISYTVGNLPKGTYYFAISAYETSGTLSAESAVGSKTIQ